MCILQRNVCGKYGGKHKRWRRTKQKEKGKRRARKRMEYQTQFIFGNNRNEIGMWLECEFLGVWVRNRFTIVPYRRCNATAASHVLLSAMNFLHWCTSFGIMRLWPMPRVQTCAGALSIGQFVPGHGSCSSSLSPVDVRAKRTFICCCLN